jgi:hypothetical protein
VLRSELPEEPIPLRVTTSFEAFVAEVEPRLRAALVALYGIEEGRDATAEALAYAWEHWQRVMGIEHPPATSFASHRAARDDIANPSSSPHRRSATMPSSRSFLTRSAGFPSSSA